MLIKDFKGKYKDIYEQNLPVDASDIIYTFQRANRTIYHNFTTGTQGEDLSNVVRNGYPFVVVKRNASNKIMGYFSSYNEKYDVFVIIPVELNILESPVDGDILYWERISDNSDCAFVFTRDIDVYISENYNSNYHVGYFDGVDVYSASIIDSGTITVISNKTIQEARKFFGYTVTRLPGDMHYKVINTRFFADLFVLFSRYESNADRHDDVLLHPLSKLSKSHKNKMFAILKNYNSNIYKNMYFVANFGEERLASNFATINYVCDDVSCIRLYTVAADYNVLDILNYECVKDINDVVFDENIRIYIYKDKTVVYKNFFGKWIVVDTSYMHVEYISFILIGVETIALKNTRLKYFKRYIINCLRAYYLIAEKESLISPNISKMFENAKNEAMVLFLSLTSDIIDGLLKSPHKCFREMFGYEELCFQTVNDVLKNYFGQIDESKHSFVKAIGVPSFMFYEINKMYNELDSIILKKYLLNFIFFMKYIFKEDISYLKNIDYNEFKTILGLYLESAAFYPTRYELNDIVYKMIVLAGSNNVIKYMNQIMNIFKNDAFLPKDISSFVVSCTYDIYKDYIDMFYELRNNLTGFRFNFKSYSEIEAAHSELVDIYNIESEKYYDENLKDSLIINKPIWDKLNYQEDEFSIIAPNTYTDIANEGLILHHCVKTYIEDVAKGKTTILFIRKTGDLDKPFFTLEVRDNKIRQCHGFANCNTDTVVGLDEFLKRFCIAKNVRYCNTDEVLAAG